MATSQSRWISLALGGVLLGILALAAVLQPSAALRERQSLMLAAVNVEADLNPRFLSGHPRAGRDESGDVAAAYVRLLRVLRQPGTLGRALERLGTDEFAADREQVQSAARCTLFREAADLLSPQNWFSGARLLEQALREESAALPAAVQAKVVALAIEFAGDLKATGSLDCLALADRLDAASRQALQTPRLREGLHSSELAALIDRLKKLREAHPQPHRIARGEAMLAQAMLLACGAIPPFDTVANSWGIAERSLAPAATRDALSALGGYQQHLFGLLLRGRRPADLDEYASWLERLTRIAPAARSAVVHANQLDPWFVNPARLLLMELELRVEQERRLTGLRPDTIENLVRRAIGPSTVDLLPLVQALDYRPDGESTGSPFAGPPAPLAPLVMAVLKASWSRHPGPPPPP